MVILIVQGRSLGSEICSMEGSPRAHVRDLLTKAGEALLRRSPQPMSLPFVLSYSHMVDLTPLVLSPGGFHFSYLPGNGAHKLHGPGFPW